jgi:PAS domain S-box-containing protein
MMAASQADSDRALRKGRFGVRAKTLSGLAVLLGMLLATTAALVADSWVTLRDATRAEASNALAGELARAALDLAVERGITNGALTSPVLPEAAVVAEIRKRRAASGAMFRVALQRVENNPDVLSATMRADLLAAAERVSELRRDVDVELGRPLSQRNPQTSEAWLPAISGLLEIMRQAIGEQGTPAATMDAELQAVLEARMSAFDLRNAAGERAALISGVLGSRTSLSLADAVLIGSRSEATELHWRRLLRLAASIPDPRLDGGLDEARQGYFGSYVSLLNRIADAGLEGLPYPVDFEDFTEATFAPLQSLNQLVFLTQAIATEMLRHRARSADLRLYGSVAAVIAGLAVAGFSVVAFSYRVVRPIEQVTEAMRRLVAGTAVAADLPLEQPDEIGEMSRAIAAFRDTIIASEAALSNAERFTHQTIDALPTHIAVLNEHGIIIATNKSWRAFAQMNNGPRTAYEGQNYLAVCDRSVGSGDDGAAAIAAGIRSVIAGLRSEFELEYPCHSPAARRWFRMRVTRFAAPGPMRIVVAHDDITSRKLAEEGLQERNHLLELAEQMSRTGHWRYDRATRTLRWSSEIYRIHGRSPEDFSPDPITTLAAYHPDDREILTRAGEAAVNAGTGFSLDLRLFRTDGQLRNVEVLAACEKDETGQVVALFGVFRDITDRKKNEERLADLNTELERRVAEQTAQLSAREAYLRGILDNVAEIVMTIDETGRIESFNPAAQRAFGYEAAEVIGTSVDRLIADPEPGRRPGYIRRLLDSGAFRIVGAEGREITAIRKDGTKMPAEITVAEMEIGGRVRFIGAMRDVTERKRAERTLLERATLLRRAQDLAKAGHWSWHKERRTGGWYTGLEYSPALALIFGVPPEDLIIDEADYVARFVHPEDRAFVTEAFRTWWHEPLEYRIVRPDGNVRHIREVVEYVAEDAADPSEVVGMVQDITERKLAELALRDSEARLRAIFDHAPVTISLRDVDGRYVMVNRRFQEIFGLAEHRIVGWTPEQFYPPRFLAGIASAIDQVRRTKSTVVSEEGAPTIHGDRRYLTTRFPIVDDAGNLTGIGSISVDVTEQRAAEAALRESEARLRTIYESEPEWVALLSAEGGFLEINPAGLAMVEAGDPRTIVGRRVDALVAPECREAFGDLVARVFDGGSGSLLFEMTGLRGTHRWMEMNAVPLRDPDGAITAMLTIARDVTTQRDMEEQLRQAQKMESVGQLTGGLAHDFNNLLGVIVGNLDLLSLRLARRNEERELVERAISAAERGAALTHRLLAFARRQTLLPQQVNAGELVKEVAQLLRRTIGERIELEIMIDPKLMSCYVDPGQLETALLNLAINARDAMPDGGSMTISAINTTVGEDEASDGQGGASRLPPGKYVVISVADTGEGMSEQVRARAFEPFFTTKGVGKGSGLGLSMVYGFVEQSGGHVRLSSELGRGTTVSLFLEAMEGVSPAAPVPEGTRAARGNGELVLVVEDDDEMRSFAIDALHRLGYRTVAAVDGTDAVSALREHADVAALFTDVMLPGTIDGFALAMQARRLRPEMPVLYTSGFADADKLPPDLLNSEAELLPKPYRIAELGHRMERLLKKQTV